MLKAFSIPHKSPWIIGLLTLLLGADVSGLHAATTYDQMLRQLRLDSAKCPGSIHLFQIGESATKERGIWMVRISSANSPESPRLRPRVLFICRQHGDEPVSTEAALSFIHSVSSTHPKKLDSLLGPVEIYIIPMANPDGADAMTRVTGVGADLNRDWGRFSQPETRVIYAAFKLIKPYAVVDMHSWTPGDSFLSDSIEVPALDATSDTLANVDSKLQMATIANVSKITRSNVTAFEYAPTSDLTLCHRFFGTEKNVVSFLIETAPPSISTGGISGRVPMMLSAIRTVVRSLNTDTSMWKIIADTEKVNIAPDNAYTADYGGLNDAEALALRAQTKIEQTQRKSIYMSFCIYGASLMVVFCVLGKFIWFAILRLLARLDVANPKTMCCYVPYRFRRLSIYGPSDNG